MTDNQPEIYENDDATMANRIRPDKLDDSAINRFRSQMLAWYDENRRSLPWRTEPGTMQEPYYVWLSEIMLQQTVVAAVVPYFLKFVKTWPQLQDLAAASQEDIMTAWAGLGYYSRARNMHKSAQIVMADHNGRFPSDIKTLKTLPGIGEYTSHAIRAIAFDKPATVVDGNIERVLSRYFAVTQPLPESKKLLRQYAGRLNKNRADRPGDFAQALMDLGATVCIAGKPRCAVCPLQKDCLGLKTGLSSSLPMRKKRKPKPQKRGLAYWVLNEKNEVLLERRPPKGLLGGTIGLPTASWGTGALLPLSGFSPIKKDIASARRVYHSFTHFDLELVGVEAELEKPKEIEIRESYFWAPLDSLESIGFSALFKKLVTVLRHDETKTK